ncbi:MAG: hypothetical protein QM532_01385 [Cyanobium sp. MAG06]|nr:hypothetical protein [Cyanobium sp. MAG06]
MRENRIKEIYNNGEKYLYKDAKDDLYKCIIDFRNKEIEYGEYKGQKRIDVYNKLINDKTKINQILNAGKEKSINKSQETINTVRNIIGVNL